jgi:hypothetical protein
MPRHGQGKKQAANQTDATGVIFSCPMGERRAATGAQGLGYQHDLTVAFKAETTLIGPHDGFPAKTAPGWVYNIKKRMEYGVVLHNSRKPVMDSNGQLTGLVIHRLTQHPHDRQHVTSRFYFFIRYSLSLFVTDQAVTRHFCR